MTLYYNSKDSCYIQSGNDFTVSGINYPASWLSQANEAEKTAIGLQEVIATNSPEDSEYYWVSENLDRATLTYINTPKDILAVEEAQVTKVRNIAYSTLVNSDWMTARAFETGTDIPAAWKTYRQDVRTVAQNAITAINNANSVLEIKNIVSAIVWPTEPGAV